jgi:hypothetical protein
VFSVSRKWWDAATMMPITIQTTPPNETCRPLITPARLARVQRAVPPGAGRSVPGPRQRGRNAPKSAAGEAVHFDMVRYSEYVVARGECLLWQPPGSLLHLPRTPAASKLDTTLSGGKGQVMTDSDSFADLLMVPVPPASQPGQCTAPPTPAPAPSGWGRRPFRICSVQPSKNEERRRSTGI